MRGNVKELAACPELVRRILATLPAVQEPEKITIKIDAASVDVAIARALALAVVGVEARLELTSR